MKTNSSFWKGVLITIFIIVLIVYPFFTIPYFQTDKLIRFYLKFVFVPITLILLYVIYKHVKVFFTNLNNTFKKVILVTTFIPFANFIISLLFVSISTIINCNIGTSREVKLNTKVLKTKHSRGKNNRLRYYISFYDKKVGHISDLEVYDDYKEGDMFIKKMKIGSLGLLYSK